MEKLKPSVSLPSKENKIFKKLLKFYDQKNYKKGLKCCEQILSNEKYQKHQDTLSLQALMLYFTGKHDQAVKNSKLAISYNFKSSICWHTYGLIQKYMNLNFDAVKCLSKALMFDPTNQLILTELGSLQLHTRDYTSAVDSRHQLLKLKSGQKHIWLAYIVALTLADHHNTAFDITNAFISTLDEETPKSSMTSTNQYSNMVLFRIKLCLTLRNLDEANSLIDSQEEYIFDKLQLYQLKFEIFVQKGDTKNAIIYAIKLLKFNPNNFIYYEQILQLLQCKTSNQMIKIYQYFSNLFPRAFYPKIRLLELSKNVEFKSRVIEFVETSIRKGQPNLFSSLKVLYIDTQKVTVIEQIITDLEVKFDQDPCSIWIMYYFGQHYHFTQNYKKAIFYTHKLLSHTPTFIDAIILKAQILNKIGDIKNFIETLAFAQSLDTADRHINSIFAKALVKHQQLDRAVTIMKIYQFKCSSFWSYMKEIECMWLIERVSKMFFHRKDYQRVLTVAAICDGFYSTFNNDPSDFHMYCMRKVCIESYVELHHSMPYIGNNKIFFKLCRTTIKSCLAMIHSKIESKIVPSESSDFFQPRSNDPHNIIQRFISPLISFDRNVNNYFIIFDFYFMSNNILMLTKVVKNMIDLEPTHPRTLFNYVRLISIYNSCPKDEFVVEILSHFTDMFQNVTIPSIIQSFPINHSFNIFYLYLLKIHLGEIHEIDEEKVYHIFIDSLTDDTDWMQCYSVYKEFAYNSYIVGRCSLIVRFTEKLEQLFPNCCVKNRINSTYTPQA